MFLESLPIADIFSPEIFALLIPLTALMIPIVVILVKHQQTMAQIIHGSARQHAESEITQLRNEVSELKQMLHQQMIAMDSVMSTQLQARDKPLQDRLEQKSNG